MKKSIQALLALAAFSSGPLLAHAQTEPKIFVVDMNKLYSGDYKTVDQIKKLQGQEASAQQQWDQMQKDLNALKGQIDELVEQTKDPLATAEVKAKAQADAQKKAQDYQGKVNEMNAFHANVSKEFQDSMQNFNAIVVEEISEKAAAIGKLHGATLLLDKSLQTHAVISSDPGYDLTDEVMAAINKDAPPPAPAAPAPAAAPTAPAAN
jgi:outer membrane protein